MEPTVAPDHRQSPPSNTAAPAGETLDQLVSQARALAASAAPEADRSSGAGPSSPFAAYRDWAGLAGLDPQQLGTVAQWLVASPGNPSLAAAEAVVQRVRDGHP